MLVKACAWGSGVLSRCKPLDVVRATRLRLGLNGVELRSHLASSPTHFRAERREGEPQGFDFPSRQYHTVPGVGDGRDAGLQGRGVWSAGGEYAAMTLL